MKSNSILLVLFVFFVIACEEKGGESSESAENAFAKIDKKNESFFTKEERKIKYRESIAAAEENQKSNDDDAVYNGYGSSLKKSKKNKGKKVSPKASSKIKYKSSAPVTYSAYSTN
tara:strand:- start:3731 stop:4078 length:348 start_codon:yes stop_codon:yes gene_type:complete